MNIHAMAHLRVSLFWLAILSTIGIGIIGFHASAVPHPPSFTQTSIRHDQHEIHVEKNDLVQQQKQIVKSTSLNEDQKTATKEIIYQGSDQGTSIQFKKSPQSSGDQNVIKRRKSLTSLFSTLFSNPNTKKRDETSTSKSNPTFQKSLHIKPRHPQPAFFSPSQDEEGNMFPSGLQQLSSAVIAATSVYRLFNGKPAVDTDVDIQQYSDTNPDGSRKTALQAGSEALVSAVGTYRMFVPHKPAEEEEDDSKSTTDGSWMDKLKKMVNRKKAKKKVLPPSKDDWKSYMQQEKDLAKTKARISGDTYMEDVWDGKIAISDASSSSGETDRTIHSNEVINSEDALNLLEGVSKTKPQVDRKVKSPKSTKSKNQLHKELKSAKIAISEEQHLVSKQVDIDGSIPNTKEKATSKSIDMDSPNSKNIKVTNTVSNDDSDTNENDDSLSEIEQDEDMFMDTEFETDEGEYDDVDESDGEIGSWDGFDK